MPATRADPGALQRGGLRVGVIAGEPSGDLLGAGLLREIRRTYPDARFFGVAGPAMIAEGAESWVPMERLSVMGLAEVLRHLPELARIRRRLTDRMLALRPDVVVGIDAPDFTLGVERRLRDAGIRTVHYVSPTIWAWRAGRIHGIAKAADEVLCLLPFEPALYTAHGSRARFIGHPMADAIPFAVDREASRQRLGMAPSAGRKEVVALLPGSRMGEVTRLGGEFAAAAALLAARHPGVRFIAAMASASIREMFTAQLAQRAPGLKVQLVDGRSREVIAAADVVLLASGTATLETALLKRAMVVAYKVSSPTYRILSLLRLIKSRHIALPNVMAGEEVAPELIQGAATPERIAAEVGALLSDPARRARMEARFAALHEGLRQGADRKAADAVLSLVGRLPEALP
jgi:lipid-A-disaccharide synthase